MKTKQLLMPYMIGVLLFSQCSIEESDYEKQVKKDDERIQNYLNTNQIDAKDTQIGYLYEELETNPVGESVSESDIVAFYYSMQLLDGTELDTYMDTTQAPLLFSNTTNGIWPKSLQYGINRMKTGEHFRFYIPSYLAYYDYEHNDYFQAFANFIIDVKVVDIKTAEEILETETDSIQALIARDSIDNAQVQESGLIYAETATGSGNQPVSGDFVSIHFTRKYLDGSVIVTTEDDEPFTLRLGTNQAVEGLDEGIRLMREGGEATLIMPSNLAFGKSIQVVPLGLREELHEDQYLIYDIEPYSPILYEVEVIEVN